MKNWLIAAVSVVGGTIAFAAVFGVLGFIAIHAPWWAIIGGISILMLGWFTYEFKLDLDRRDAIDRINKEDAAHGPYND
jgi:hypothetical protein